MKPRYRLPFPNRAVFLFNCATPSGSPTSAARHGTPKNAPGSVIAPLRVAGSQLCYRMQTVLVVLILALLPHTMVAGEAASSDLIGISWKLLKIAYRDDTIYKPDDPTKYTLTFQDETQVAVRIDCNRGYGTWKSSGPGKLEFGPMTITQAMCPPGSLYGLVIHDLPNFRSYVLKDGKLFLALKADGGIYEFEPLTK